ncbi:MAG: hypothetical protein ABJA66_09230 [Actinomycetota bacterium]
MTEKESYPSDPTDEQFEFIKQFFPESSEFGRPSLDLHQVLKGLFYVALGEWSSICCRKSFRTGSRLIIILGKESKNYDWERENRFSAGNKDAKQAYLDNQQAQMNAQYQKADITERSAIIGQIDSFLPVTNGDEKSFWLKFRQKLERLNEKSAKQRKGLRRLQSS